MIIKNINLIYELKEHIPLTFLGSVSGIILIVYLNYASLLDLINTFSINIFYILHPAHIFLSAVVTTSLFIKHNNKNLIIAILIGYVGSIGIATVSDSIIPFIGEIILDLPNKGLHLGLIEKPFLTNISAFIGILLGYKTGFTKFPHFGHVLISTWASLFHIIMAIGSSVNYIQIILIIIFLFFAVWIPCCTSDIVFPLIFYQKSTK
jgi:hypothetical protein